MKLRLFASFTTAMLSLLFANVANAGGPGSDWRQPDRAISLSSAKESPQNALFEIRFGPYAPKIDSAFTDKHPYADYFGASSKFYFGVEADWQAFRIPYVGVIGPGFGWGYMHASGLAKSAKDPSKNSAETTGLTIMPMHVSGVLRLDEPLKRWRVPIVPYAKLGLGLGWWSTSGPGDNQGSGLSHGREVALGGMFCLNVLDPTSASRLDRDYGVNHSYLFGEWMKADLNSGMRVGTSTWVVGLAIDR
jgi:hypothetical protein